MNIFVSVSGGLDSTALAIILSNENKNTQYIFADTGDEFPQVYEHLEKMETRLGINIIRVKSKYNTLKDYEIKQEFFPTPRARFCTRMFKIQPIEEYLKPFDPYKLAIGLRCDEDRKGGLDSRVYYPLQEKKINKEAVYKICNHFNLVPEYPFYMSRGGCYSCFFKTKKEIIGLARNEPELFNELIERENKVNAGFTERDKFFYMFQNLGMSLQKAKNLIDEGEQIEMFENSLIYEQTSCGVFCRK